MADSPLATLLVVQEHDTAADRLRYRREHLAERAELAAGAAILSDIDTNRTVLATRRAEIDANERRLGDEVASISGRATAVEQSMYSGEISSPRELQAMQADVEQLRKQQGLLEDRELELMETREQLDTEMGVLDASAATVGARSGARCGARRRARSPDDRGSHAPGRGRHHLREGARGQRGGRSSARRHVVPGLPPHDPVDRGRQHAARAARRRRDRGHELL